MPLMSGRFQVQQHQDRAMRHPLALGVVAEQMRQRAAAVRKRDDRVVHPRPADVLLDQPGMARIVLDQKDGDGMGIHVFASLV
ncbi:MAG: hypothetical protein WDN49_19115 [Acetobacteraceae bacterium]